MNNRIEIPGLGMKSGWSGHHPVTRRVLLPILLRAQAEQMNLSLDECTLITACEFWSANESGDLDSFLDGDPIENLVAACVALSAIGAVNLALELTHWISYYRSATDGSVDGPSNAKPAPIRLTTQDPVDMLIAQFAIRCTVSSLQSGLPRRDERIH